MAKAKKKALVVGEVFSHGWGVGGFMVRSGFKIVDANEPGGPDIVVFTGGADIDPQLYGEPRLKDTIIHPSRDQADLHAYEKFEKKPKLGICRGAQFLNVMSGGKMIQHVNNHRNSHPVFNLMPELFQEVFSVSSTHHQMMVPAVTGEVILIARSPDKSRRVGLATEYLSGVPRDKPEYDPEGVWYNDTNSLCFQFHPEYNTGVGKPMEDYTKIMIDHFFF